MSLPPLTDESIKMLPPLASNEDIRLPKIENGPLTSRYPPEEHADDDGKGLQYLLKLIEEEETVYRQGIIADEQVAMYYIGMTSKKTPEPSTTTTTTTYHNTRTDKRNHGSGSDGSYGGSGTTSSTPYNTAGGGPTQTQSTNNSNSNTTTSQHSSTDPATSQQKPEVVSAAPAPPAESQQPLMYAAPPRVPAPPGVSAATTPRLSKGALLALQYAESQEATRRNDIMEQEELNWLGLSIRLLRETDDKKLELQYSQVYNQEYQRAEHQQKEIATQEEQYNAELRSSLEVGQAKAPAPLPEWESPRKSSPRSHQFKRPAEEPSILQLPGYDRSYIPRRWLSEDEFWETMWTIQKDEENLRPRVAKLERSQRSLLQEDFGGAQMALASIRIQCAWRQHMARREVHEMRRLQHERLDRQHHLSSPGKPTKFTASSRYNKAPSPHKSPTQHPHSHHHHHTPAHHHHPHKHATPRPPQHNHNHNYNHRNRRAASLTDGHTGGVHLSSSGGAVGLSTAIQYINNRPMGATPQPGATWYDPDLRARMEYVKDIIKHKFNHHAQMEVMNYVYNTTPACLHTNPQTNVSSLNLYEMSRAQFEVFEAYVYAKANSAPPLPSNVITNSNPYGNVRSSGQSYVSHHSNNGGGGNVRASHNSQSSMLDQSALSVREILAKRIQKLPTDDQKVLVGTVRRIAPHCLKKLDGNTFIDTADLNDDQYLRVSNVVLELLQEAKEQPMHDNHHHHRSHHHHHRRKHTEDDHTWIAEQRRRDEEDREWMKQRLKEDRDRAKERERFRMDLERKEMQERLRWEKDEHERQAEAKALERARRQRESEKEADQHRLAELEERMYQRKQRELAVKAQQYELERKAREDEENRVLQRDQAILARELHDMTSVELDEVGSVTFNICPQAVQNKRVQPGAVPIWAIQWVLKSAVDIKDRREHKSSPSHQNNSNSNLNSAQLRQQDELALGAQIEERPQASYSAPPPSKAPPPAGKQEDQQIQQQPASDPPPPPALAAAPPKAPSPALAPPSRVPAPPTNPPPPNASKRPPAQVHTSESPLATTNRRQNTLPEPTLEQKSMLKDAIVNLPTAPLRQVVGRLSELCPHCVVYKEGSTVHLDTQYLDANGFYEMQQLVAKQYETAGTYT